MTDRAVLARRRAEWITDKYILAMLLVFPLFTGFAGYRQITEAKLWFFLAATLLWLAGAGGCCLWAGLRPGRPGLAGSLLAGFFLWACLSALCSPYRESVLLGAGRYDGLLTLGLYVLTAMGVSRLGRPRRRYLYAFGLSVGLCCLVGLLQLAGWNPLGLYPQGWGWADRGILYSGAFLGTVGNTVLLAAVLCLAVPLLLAAVFCRGESPLLLVPAALALFILWRTDSSSGAVALAGGAFLLPARLLPPGQRRRRVLWVQALVLLAGLVLLYAVPWRSGTVYELSRILRGDFSPGFGSSRLGIWKETLALVPERPLLGGGPGTLALRVDIRFSRFVPETGQTLSTYVDNAHNEYLGFLADLGIPGLALYLGAMAATFFSSQRWRGRAVPWGCALVCYWIQAFFGLGLCLTAPLLWLSWGLFLSGGRQEPAIPPGTGA